MNMLGGYGLYTVHNIIQEASSFKLSSLQHQLSESVPRAVLEKANQEYGELVIKYQQCLQKQTAYAAETSAIERLQVSICTSIKRQIVLYM